MADEVRKVLGESVPHNVPHVVEEISGEPAVLRVYHALGDLQTTKKHITDFIEKVQITPGLAALSDCRDYGLLVLSATLERNDELTKELTRQKLANTALVVCGVGPTVDTLAPLLRERRRRRAKPD